MPAKLADPVAHFWSKVQKGNEDECWPWTLHQNQGYGRFDGLRIGCGTRRAHRIAWIILFGQIKNGLEVCHTCDNGLCCNPKHLFLGQHKRNMEDMARKGRAKTKHGSEHKLAKLNEATVSEIRSIYSTGTSSLKRLAGIYSVSKRLILNIVHRTAWKHVV